MCYACMERHPRRMWMIKFSMQKTGFLTFFSQLRNLTEKEIALTQSHRFFKRFEILYFRRGYISLHSAFDFECTDSNREQKKKCSIDIKFHKQDDN